MITPEQEKEWLKQGFDPTTLLHRKLLIEKIEKYEPFSCIFDVGCANGPDMKLLDLKYSGITICGTDTIPIDRYENVKLVSGRNDLVIVERDLREFLPQLEDKFFDVTFTNGTLMYVGVHWVKELLRITKKAVILSERCFLPEWEGYLKDLGLNFEVTKVDQSIRETWKNDGYIFEIKL